mgnify:CR=1 FL=1
MILADRILQEIIVTEKATELSSNQNKYTFQVHPAANSISIRQAVEKVFDVKVTKVNVINVKPKAKRDRSRGGRMGYKARVKKAIVSLVKGESIEII